MKRRVLLILYCLILPGVLMTAQDTKVWSKVELINGKTDLIGSVLQQPDGGYLVETETGDVFYYSQDEIKNITTLISDEAKKQARQLKKQEQMLTLGKDRSKIKGLMCIVEGGLGYSFYEHRNDMFKHVLCNHRGSNSSEYDDPNYSKYYVCPSLSVVAGYRFSPNLFMGVGIGLDDPLAYKAFPLFIHLRSELTKRKIAPYLALSVGSAYLDYFPTDIEDDIFIDGAIGIRKHLNKHGSMWYGLSCCYIYRAMETAPYRSTDIIEYSRVVRFKISYSF
ncbi:MAG: hypothetical protein J6Q19_06935 [Bacteroidaceae bacterium]|nr:hypothetical protein [Bacteroidaceae bacterium]